MDKSFNEMTEEEKIKWKKANLAKVRFHAAIEEYQLILHRLEVADNPDMNLKSHSLEHTLRALLNIFGKEEVQNMLAEKLQEKSKKLANQYLQIEKEEIAKHKNDIDKKRIAREKYIEELK